jgi:hypothetical protein
MNAMGVFALATIAAVRLLIARWTASFAFVHAVSMRPSQLAAKAMIARKAGSAKQPLA